MGIGEYIQRVRAFSRNARLDIIHIVGMDVIYGSWQVLFNLYFLQAFANGASFNLFGTLCQFTALQLIGARLVVGGVAGAIGALPVGMLSDRLGRKDSFIPGDYVGAIVAMGNITTLNPVVLLITPVFESIFGTLHQVSEAAFQSAGRYSTLAQLFIVVGMIFGLMNAFFGQFNFFAPWLVIAYVLLAAILVVRGSITLVWQQRVFYAATEAEDPALANLRDENNVRAVQWAYVAMPVVIIYAMVMKPGGIG
jgi:hypothetical protein